MGRLRAAHVRPLQGCKPRALHPQRLAEHLQTLVQELFGLGEKAQTVDIQRAFHAGGVTAAQQQRRKGAADLALLEVAAQAPADLVINTHVCRGNYHSTFFSSGAYDGVADLLFGEENVNAYYLEYDDERSGGFAPLAKVSGDKKVVLGLVTTKSPVLEKKEDVIARIHEAAKHVPLDRLYLSPQCGFASCEIGNKLTEEEQWAKLKLVKEIAEEVWR